ncbi:MBL fold metallo-hydrolase [Patescibacteria group bacterium]|nr:MBL fold metallo-hydrolase [Patescibacteria group bacterium]MBU1028750.1 MBL fold metallo-hydrolase [Patescibacteria group bacterium]
MAKKLKSKSIDKPNKSSRFWPAAVLYPIFVGLLFLSGAYSTEVWAWSVTKGADFSVHFFAVGQGDAALVQCGNTQALIDGGPDRTILERLGRTMPFTDRSLEFVILSHPHIDHIFGLFAVLERYSVRKLIVFESIINNILGSKLLELARQRGTEIVLVDAGDSLVVGECGELAVLWPDQQSALITGSEPDRENDLSLVLELRTVDQQPTRPLVLFTGDIGAQIEKMLLTTEAVGPIDILKVAHHGSRYSSIFDFIQTIRPESAVISVGHNNYGQPAAIVLQRLNRIDARVWRTDQFGDVSFDLSNSTHFLE